jgi:DNA-binding IclR family transcriptional regulator
VVPAIDRAPYRHGRATVRKRSPAHATAIGKALLATLPDAEVRRRYGRRALERRTPQTVASVAALVDHTGAAVGAVGLSGPSGRLTAIAARRLGGELRATAARVSAALGAHAA